MEVDSFNRTIKVVEASQPFAARAAVRDMAHSAGFDEADSYRAGLVATELATNLVKHTGGSGGELLLRLTGPQPVGEIELIAVDRGPGMRDVGLCMTDGHSSTGTSGTGLGAVRRLADDFDVHSDVGRGTVVLARIRAGRRSAAPVSGFDIAAVSLPAPGEQACGDAWWLRSHPDGLAMLVVDGLGHGLPAADAAREAVGIFDNEPYRGPADMLQIVHRGLRHTRGAAAAIADIRLDRNVVTMSGVGNVAVQISEPGSTRMAVSLNGTLGHQVRAFREYTYPWSPSAIVVLHTDGMSSQWSLDAAPGLRYRQSAVIAALLYCECTRGRDDITVVVARKRP